jgi:shikimate kinase
MRRTIWLVGMMGAGKSAVGAALARELRKPFFDVDAAVERRAGKGVAAIFADDGEPRFRALERAEIERLAASGAVVALGGGAIAQPGIPTLLRRTGRVIWLQASPATILARIGDAADRPLLAGLSDVERAEKLAKLLAERRHHYATAELAVPTDGRAVDRVAREIVAKLGQPAPGR